MDPDLVAALLVVPDYAVVLSSLTETDAAEYADNSLCLTTWTSLLPAEINSLIASAEQHMWPFLAPNLTPDLMTQANQHIPELDQKALLMQCLYHALKSEAYTTAAAVAFVLDRFLYWYGGSPMLLKAVDIIEEQSPATAIAPQLTLRKARVMKDSGDLHGAMRVLDSLLEQDERKTDSKWHYKDEDQRRNVHAVCVQIKGQILHNLGLWKQAVSPLMNSIDLFNELSKKDEKGISSTLGILAKCLRNMTMEDYQELRPKFQFKHDDPCYEAYSCSTGAVELSPKQSLFLARHQCQAEEALLMYAVRQPEMATQHHYLAIILKELKISLGAHQVVETLESAEQFYEFNRALFMNGLSLNFSSALQDKNVSILLEEISMILYGVYCTNQECGIQNPDISGQILYFINLALAVLNLPALKSQKSDTGITRSSQAGSDKTQQMVVGESMKSSELKTPSEVNEERATDTCSKDASVFKNMDDASFEMVLLETVQSLPDSIENITSSDGSDSSFHFIKDVGLPVDPDKYSSSSEDGSVSGAAKRPTVSSPGVKNKTEDADSLPALVDLSASTLMSSFEFLDKSKSSVGLNISKSALSDDFVHLHVDKEARNEDRSSSVGQEARNEDRSSSVGQEACNEDRSSSVGQEARNEDRSSSVAAVFGEKVPFLFDSVIASGVSRATVLKYQPGNKQWVGQSTLAHLGSEVKVTKKGSCRNVYHVWVMHQDEPLARYVGKRYRSQQDPQQYMNDVMCQSIAGYYVTLFNQSLSNFHSKVQIHYLPVAHLQLLTPSGQLHDWVNIEPYVTGDFTKLTNNLRYCNEDSKEVSTALTHFSYQESEGRLMLVDLQGWMPSDQGGIIYLTDPLFHTRKVERFSPGDHGVKGMETFWNEIHTECNDICKHLNLKRT